MQKEKFKIGDVFKVDNCDLEFKFTKAKPTEILSIITLLAEQNFKANETVYNFILEHTQVNLEQKWMKLKSGDFYFPPYVEEEIGILQAIVLKYITDYLMESFQKSAQ